MKSTPRPYILWIILTLFYASMGQAADINNLFDSVKKAVSGGSSLTNDEMIQGLKEALKTGTQNAVATVSKADGYYKNPDIKIPLPEEIEKAGKYLRLAGYGPKVDEFEQSMNRAAEHAAPEAKQLFWGAVKEMKIEDAQKILDGPDNAATSYFKDNTYAGLQNIFKPIVKETVATAFCVPTLRASLRP